jgi:hypothetical protein
MGGSVMKMFCRVSVVLGVAVLMAGPALGQGRGRGRGNIPPLATNKSVQQELKLTEEQVKKVGETVAEVDKKHEDDLAEIRKIEDMMERGTKMRELMATKTTEVNKALADILKPDQLKRYKQIELQQRANSPFGGGLAGVFATPEIATELKLTDDQKEKIKGIGEDFQKDAADARANAGGDFAAMQEKMTAMRKEVTTKITGLLTDEQKKTWKEMTGEPFEVKYPMGGGRGKKKDM